MWKFLSSSRTSTCIMAVKTNSLNFYMPPTPFVAIKSDFLNIYTSLTLFVAVKTDSKHPQASYIVCSSQK